MRLAARTAEVAVAMTLNDALLKRAIGARERLDQLGRETDRAKSEFCEAVQQLHASGASLREIADALGLSHQRIHQLVSGTSGGVLERLGVRRPRQAAPPRSCSFCAAPHSEARRLVAGPNLWICDACVRAASEVVRGASPRPGGMRGFQSLSADSPARCSFCGKGRRRVEGMVVGQAGPICNHCLVLCLEIVEA
jgi:ClpX C4-type zinc finger